MVPCTYSILYQLLNVQILCSMSGSLLPLYCFFQCLLKHFINVNWTFCTYKNTMPHASFIWISSPRYPTALFLSWIMRRHQLCWNSQIPRTSWFQECCCIFDFNKHTENGYQVDVINHRVSITGKTLTLFLTTQTPESTLETHNKAYMQHSHHKITI